MEKRLTKDLGLKTFLLALTLVSLAFAMITIVYGVDSVAKGAHDVFHDFRHAIGIPCH
ncbi:MAG: CbtB-domain containing protein [Deltaproteobacteria bacterium]|nr:CbtB-domain containing protein [Deltaproteobacteria bacterium]